MNKTLYTMLFTAGAAGTLLLSFGAWALSKAAK
jgi:hypothetical protein